MSYCRETQGPRKAEVSTPNSIYLYDFDILCFVVSSQLVSTTGVCGTEQRAIYGGICSKAAEEP